MRSHLSRRPPLVIALFVAAGLASAGCHSYKPLIVPGSAVAQQVKVQFSQPRDLAGRTAAGADSVLNGVAWLEGQVFAVSTDTLQLTVLKISDSSGARPAPTGFTTRIHQDPSVAVDVMSFDANRTAAATGAGIYVGVFVVTLALVAAILSAGRW